MKKQTKCSCEKNKISKSHLKKDDKDFDYIDKEANDIKKAIKRLKKRDKKH